MQFGKLEDEVYPKLEAYGIKQIAQRTAGFDMYDLDLAKNMVLLFLTFLVIHLRLSQNILFLSHYNLYVDSCNRKTRTRSQLTWAAPIMSRPVKNMTVAIIGTGRIGAATAKIYAGFGAKVVGYDAYPNHSLDFLEYKDSVEEAIKDADIISLHVPANKASTYLIKKCLRKLRKVLF